MIVGGRTARRRDPGAAVAIMVLVVAMASGLLAGCGRPEYRYVTDKGTSTYLKVPRSWTVFDGDAVASAESRALAVSGSDPPSAIDRRIEQLLQWRVAFDSARVPSPDHVANLSESVVVDVRVRRLLARERDQVNLAALRNLIVPYDELSQSEQESEASKKLGAATKSDFRPLREEEIASDNGMHGVRLTFQVRGAARVYLIDQTALVDVTSSRLWVLVVRASEAEYFANRKQIDAVVDSFTVKPKD